MAYTLHDQLLCLERQINLMQKTYPRAVAAGKITAQSYNRELGAMLAIKKTLMDLCDGVEPLPQAPRYNQYGVRT